MCKKPLPAILVVCLSFLGTGALADPAYKARDIIQHFAPKAELGPSRGLCIGHEGECGGQGPPASVTPPTAAFDLVVTFDYDSDTLTRDARENLDEFAKALKDPQLAATSFRVEGHTDARGSDRYNLSLSERRAASVVRYLTEIGIEPGRLKPRGYGKTQPRTPDPNDASNRRVETVRVQ
ncbi:OmpA family protein [Microvirga pakistanensis]|uniref:OmpA family protein n=1 Tax=Microvirga pakistanensis TaxID=1682650 RepID=UPI00106925F4|nr:OmpA family protein [Microvirga pakistanensis]